MAKKTKTNTYAINKGDLRWVDPQGGLWEPVACGDHRSVPIHDTTTNDDDGTPDGFQPDCEACVAEAETAFDSYHRSGAIERGASSEERRASRTPAG